MAAWTLGWTMRYLRWLQEQPFDDPGPRGCGYRRHYGLDRALFLTLIAGDWIEADIAAKVLSRQNVATMLASSPLCWKA